MAYDDQNIDNENVEFDEDYTDTTVEDTPDETTGEHRLLTDILFEATLDYIGVPYERVTENGESAYTWTIGQDDDTKSYTINVHDDASFTTAVEVGNTVRKMNFNNIHDSQNIFSAALDLLQKDNKTEE